MHLRNFGNHVTVRAPSAPQGNQCEMTFFTLCGGYNLLFYQMIGVHVMVILATRTLRERKKTQSRVFFRLNFYVYTDVDNRERARARNKKKRNFLRTCDMSIDYEQSPIFPSKIVERATSERAWKSPHARKVRHGRGEFHVRSRFARSTIPEDKWGTTRSLSFP